MLRGIDRSPAKARYVAMEVSAQQVHDEPRHRMLIDVREHSEWEQGYLVGALHLPVRDIEARIEEAVPDYSTSITVYCAHGVRSLSAAKVLHEMGYDDVTSMAGGISAWITAGYDVVAGGVLTSRQRLRYRQHLGIPEIGEHGQARLLKASVLIVGVGGLGSPAALYLAAAGVGTLGLVDDDVVDVSNLQRQILHSEERLGMRKTASARIALTALNPEVRIIEHSHGLDAETARPLIEQYDVIINGSDNFATRYLVNDIAVSLRTPVVDGAVSRFEGQLTTIIPFVSACYRCRHPVPPSDCTGGACVESGVLSTLPGIVGTIQATEAIKLILGVGDPLAGRVLHIDALDMTFREFRVSRDPECEVCGERAAAAAPPPAGRDVSLGSSEHAVRARAE